MIHTPFFRVLVLGGMLAGALSLQADEPSKPDAKDAEIAALRAMVLKQAEEIHKLKAELDAARGLPLGNVKIVPSPTVPQLPAQPEGRVPSDWKSREFNGVTFYIIPLTFDVPARNAPRPPFAPQGTLLPKSAAPDKK